MYTSSFERLRKCLDFHDIIQLLCGKKINDSAPYDPVPLAVYGLEEFRHFVEYVASCAHAQGKSVTFHPALAVQIFDKLKQAIASTIWGINFHNVGAKMLVILTGDLKGKTISELQGDGFVTELSVAGSSEKFTLEPSFHIKLNTAEGRFTVKFYELQL